MTSPKTTGHTFEEAIASDLECSKLRDDGRRAWGSRQSPCPLDRLGKDDCADAEG